jgi:hypothetical protein
VRCRSCGRWRRAELEDEYSGLEVVTAGHEQRVVSGVAGAREIVAPKFSHPDRRALGVGTGVAVERQATASVTRPSDAVSSTYEWITVGTSASQAAQRWRRDISPRSLRSCCLFRPRTCQSHALHAQIRSRQSFSGSPDKLLRSASDHRLTLHRSGNRK